MDLVNIQASYWKNNEHLVQMLKIKIGWQILYIMLEQQKGREVLNVPLETKFSRCKHCIILNMLWFGEKNKWKGFVFFLNSWKGNMDSFWNLVSILYSRKRILKVKYEIEIWLIPKCLICVFLPKIICICAYVHKS